MIFNFNITILLSFIYNVYNMLETSKYQFKLNKYETIRQKMQQFTSNLSVIQQPYYRWSWISRGFTIQSKRISLQNILALGQCCNYRRNMNFYSDALLISASRIWSNTYITTSMFRLKSSLKNFFYWLFYAFICILLQNEIQRFFSHVWKNK